jgi:tRNA(Ile)-lysidine synthase
MGFPQKFNLNLASDGAVKAGDTLILAVSGGADSMALLHAFSQARRTLGFRLIIAHFDHNLRASSGKDLLFVERAALGLGLECVTQVNRRAVPEKGSVEAFARECRYDFLFRTARRFKASAVVTAHTKDDLAETVLMRVLRGTGLLGLRSILPCRVMGGIKLVRPLLIFSRQEVEDFLKSIKARFITDPTNASLDFTRNKIRRQLIPCMEREYQAGVKDNLARLAETAAVDYAFIEERAIVFLGKHLKCSPQRVSVPLPAFQRLHSSLRRTVVRLMYASLLDNTHSLALLHVDQIEQMALAAKAAEPKGKITLPAGVICTKTGTRLVMKVSSDQ